LNLLTFSVFPAHAFGEKSVESGRMDLKVKVC